MFPDSRCRWRHSKAWRVESRAPEILPASTFSSGLSTSPSRSRGVRGPDWRRFRRGFGLWQWLDVVPEVLHGAVARDAKMVAGPSHLVAHQACEPDCYRHHV